jgi:cullin 1
VDRSLLKRCTEVFVAMGIGRLDVYHAELETPLLSATRTFYRAAAAQWLDACSTPEYLERAESALTAEAERVRMFLHETTESVLLLVLEDEVLKAHQSSLLDKPGSGVADMLASKARSDLARLYRLYARVNGGLIPLARAVREYIQGAGLAVVAAREASAASDAGPKKLPKGAAAEGDVQFVKSLLELLSESKALIATVFGGHSLFQKALKDAFEVFVNKDTSCAVSGTQAIAGYCDRLLRSGGERLSDELLQEELQSVVNLFSYIVDKDMFGDAYRQALSKRLLAGRSASRDAEKSIVSMLKLSCGAQYTSKLEGMLKDMHQGTDGNAAFAGWVAGGSSAAAAVTQGLPPYEFMPQILTTGWWPTHKRLTLALPPALASWQRAFETFYSSTTSHRELTWVHSQGSAVVKGTFDKAYDFTVTTLQAAALLFFNGVPAGSPLSFPDVVAGLGCEEDVVKRVLHSLSCGKYKLLNKSPTGRTIGSTDTFEANPAFSAGLRKIRVPMASLEDTGSVKRVEEDRRVAIDAAIVRIMKTRQSLAHQALFAEVLSALALFKPNPKLIKRRIEYMIEADYIERDDSDVNKYHYVA